MITITTTDVVLPSAGGEEDNAKHVLQTRTEKYEDVGEATGNLIIRLYNGVRITSLAPLWAYVKQFTSGLFYSN